MSPPGVLQQYLREAGFAKIQVETITRNWLIESVDEFWENLIGAAPPLAYLFEQLGPENTQAVGEVFIQLVQQEAVGRVISLPADAHIGIGTKP